MKAIAVVLGGSALLALAMSACAAPPAGTGAGTAGGTPGWVAAWSASPQSGDTTQFSDQTVRNIVYTSVGGNEIRIRLSNTFGGSPLTVGATSVGVVLDGAQLAPGTSHAVTFGGRSSVTISAGQQVVSDPVNMRVPSLTELAVDLYLPKPTSSATYHAAAWLLRAERPGPVPAGRAVPARGESGHPS